MAAIRKSSYNWKNLSSTRKPLYMIICTVYVFILYTYTFLPCKHGKSLVIYVGETMPMPSVMYFCSVETLINHWGNA